jgi:putative PIN family toxin of toxin-antitoxin system
MRVVLDTNILLSAILSPRGAPAQIIEAWERNLFTLAICPELLTELADVAQRPSFRARLHAGVAARLAASLRDLAVSYRDLPSASGAPDQKDNFLLALSDASQADFLVTGDKGLLSLKRYKASRIIAPAALIEFLKAQSGE